MAIVILKPAFVGHLERTALRLRRKDSCIRLYYCYVIVTAGIVPT